MPTTSLAPRTGRAGAPRGDAALTVAFAAPTAQVLLVRVTGDLDLASAPELDHRVRAELSRRRARRLVMDLSGLQFLGLSGVAVFERLRRGAAAEGTGMILVGLRTAAERALQFAGVLERFPRYPDLPSALGAAGGPDRQASS
jgi:anti-sigma B factor antagonist